MPHLAVFSSNLKGFIKAGSLHRNLQIYERFAQDGWDVSFYTTDRTNKFPDIGFAARLYPQFPYILPKHFNSLYRVFMPLLRFNKGKKTDVIITHQAYAGPSAIIAGRLWGAKVIARCGMVYGEGAEQLKKTGKNTRKKLRWEKKTFKHADKCLIPTQRLADWVVQNYGIERNKVAVVPNYVDTDTFKPNPNMEKTWDVICVGRLAAKKRHMLLLESLKGTQVKVLFIGQGKLQQELSDFIKSNEMDVTITARVANEHLSSYFNRAKIYVNVAEWEGHPKALIEAMACGCACIGAKSPGIEDLIIAGKVGILVSPDIRQIRNTVKRLLKDEKLRESLGKNARDYAVEHFSIHKVFKQYQQAINEVLAD